MTKEKQDELPLDNPVMGGEAAGSRSIDCVPQAKDEKGSQALPQVQAEPKATGAERVLARDIQIDPALHERRTYDRDDIEKAKAVARQRHLLAPLPVFEKGNCLYLVDGFAVLEAAKALDPKASVSIRKVSKEEAQAIRLADNRPKYKREPMALARLALMRKRAGVQQEEIAKELGVTASNVSHMVNAARAEEVLENIAPLLTDRPRLSRRFWEDVHTTIERRRKADEVDPGGQGSHMARFVDAIAGIVEAGDPISSDDLREKLGINVRSAEPQRRNRRIGNPVKRAGLTVELTVARKRQGGAVINFPPLYPTDKFEEVLLLVVNYLADAGQAS